MDLREAVQAVYDEIKDPIETATEFGGPLLPAGQLWILSTAEVVVHAVDHEEKLTLILLAGFRGWLEEAKKSGVFPYHPTPELKQRLGLTDRPWPSFALFEEFVYQLFFVGGRNGNIFQTADQADSLNHFLESLGKEAGQDLLAALFEPSAAEE